MILPIRTDSPLRNTPYMNWLLILANVIVFLAQVYTQHGEPRRLSGLELYPQDTRLYQYFTYAFLHANALHIVGNMLFLYIFGNNVNDKMGNLGYLAFYLAGGVFAGIAYVVTQPVAPVLGASGAVAAVTGAYLVLFPRSSITVIYFFWLIGQFELPSLYFILFFFAQDVVLNFAHASGVAHMAHIGGTIFGSGICFALLATRLLPRDQFDVVALIQRWNKRRQYRDLVSRGFDPFGYVPPSKAEARKASDPATLKAQEMRAQISEAIAHRNIGEAAALYLQLKQIDPQQVLSRTAQLDIANQLASEQKYAEAAEAYESFLRFYPNYEQIEHVQLMLGLICGRYLCCL
ncbi:MAG TPA: rhomboid family intramembrane serine protease, partial [Tepidisphaeraceae bacterium]